MIFLGENIAEKGEACNENRRKVVGQIRKCAQLS